MTAIAENRDTPTREGRLGSATVATSVTMYQGILVSIDTDGKIRPARATSTDKVVGRAVGPVPGTAGAEWIYERGVFRWENSGGGDEITVRGTVCFAQDNQTVAKTSNGGVRPAAGKVVDIDSLGVWVESGLVSSGDFPATADNLAVGGTLDVTGMSTLDDLDAVDVAISGTLDVAGAATFDDLRPGGVKRATADTNYVVLATDRLVILSTTGAGNRTITFGDTAIDGQEVVVVMAAAAGGGDYTTIGIDDSGNQVLFNAAGEAATFRYLDTEDKWILVSLARATQP